MQEENEKNRSLIEQVKYLAEESILLYNDTSLIRSAIVQIPQIGSIIDIFLTSRGQQISYQRLLDLINDLQNEISEIQGKIDDLSFFESEDFYDLLIKAIEASLKTRHDEKREIYAKILASSYNYDNSNSESYIDIISELSIEELIVAKKMYELRTTTKDRFGEMKKEIRGDKDIPVTDKDVLAYLEIGIPKEDFEFILLRLQRSGLLKEQIGGMLVGYHGGTYDITEMFKKLMERINNNRN
jgi:hypothetical protein